jgi:hypothetical protein
MANSKLWQDTKEWILWTVRDELYYSLIKPLWGLWGKAVTGLVLGVILIVYGWLSAHPTLVYLAVGALIACAAILGWQAIQTLSEHRVLKPVSDANPNGEPDTELRLSVGRITAAFERLKDAVYIQFEVVVFPCPHGLKFESLSGQVYYKQLSISDGTQKPIEEETLSAPHLEEFANLGLQGTWIMLRQHVSRSLADKILQALVLPDVRLEFHFHELNIMVSSASSDSEPQRLPLWGGVGCQHGMSIHPIMRMTIHETIHTNASV